jgi:hypothetical protein
MTDNAHAHSRAAGGVLSAHERRQILDRKVAEMEAQGARLESHSHHHEAILVKGKPIHHLAHFLIGLITVGVWWLVWAGLAIFGGVKRYRVSVDEQGSVHTTKI